MRKQYLLVIQRNHFIDCRITSCRYVFFCWILAFLDKWISSDSDDFMAKLVIKFHDICRLLVTSKLDFFSLYLSRSFSDRNWFYFVSASLDLHFFNEKMRLTTRPIPLFCSKFNFHLFSLHLNFYHCWW